MEFGILLLACAALIVYLILSGNWAAVTKAVLG